MQKKIVIKQISYATFKLKINDLEPLKRINGMVLQWLDGTNFGTNNPLLIVLCARYGIPFYDVKESTQ
jgi:hypothetical protein